MQGYSIYGVFIKHMRVPVIFSQCISEFAISNLTPNTTIILVIPIYEFIVYPFFRRYIVRILRRIGLGMILALIGTAGILLMDIFGHRESMHNIIVNGTDANIVYRSEHCMFFNVDFTSSLSPVYFKATSFMPIIFVMSLGEFLISVPSK